MSSMVVGPHGAARPAAPGPATHLVASPVGVGTGQDVDDEPTTLPAADAWSRRATDALGDRMRARGDTACVVVPALQEEATVGDVVARLHRDLVGTGLLTEVVVVDGGSTDDTAGVAAAAGARVVRQRRPGDGPTPRDGKGAALQRGVAATGASLVAFVDADVVALDTSFVPRLLAPLVDDDALLVKAAYDRPLDGASDDELGGGRVTELVARPLLATFWPELSDLAQPLAGEYAGRRALLESLPFVVGYGVEIALLVDTLAAHGRGAITEVPLGSRRHRHQSLGALGRMATEILGVALARAEAQGRRARDAPVLRRPVRGRAGRTLVDHEVTWDQLPPLRP